LGSAVTKLPARRRVKRYGREFLFLTSHAGFRQAIIALKIYSAISARPVGLALDASRRALRIQI